jgi:hypothetical protein
MFTRDQDSNSSESLTALGGGGFGGYWPAKIWNSFAQAEFSNLPVESFLTPQFSGQKWNLLGPVPAQKKKKKTVKCFFAICTAHGHGHNPFGTPTVTPTPTDTTTNPGLPTATASASPSATASATATATATAGTGTGPGGGGAQVRVDGVETGLVLGGVLSVLPGTLLWARASRRRRRRRDGAR